MKSSGSIPATGDVQSLPGIIAAGDAHIRELETRLGEDGNGFLAFEARFRLQVEINGA
ncbi:MAG: hypothetical protein OXC82_04330 [Rhodobacteraceae bacterium]|nr:hypothetical protein [Paracoccaceae bacterium]MCY4249648.1 hypothetical protein [Paracoccaceae bacterium]